MYHQTPSKLGYRQVYSTSIYFLFKSISLTSANVLLQPAILNFQPCDCSKKKKKKDNFLGRDASFRDCLLWGRTHSLFMQTGTIAILVSYTTFITQLSIFGWGVSQREDEMTRRLHVSPPLSKLCSTVVVKGRSREPRILITTSSVCVIQLLMHSTNTV